ncbi:YbcC family protein [Dermatobacter hominis]|uniref:YbcC family protein n=1 Tax=Dermatobacter hominis TaxID=2884263 RepID=UPI001D11F3DD|nr:DUF2309 domain-containing protein [Dermatobacter hominis]UDY37619.1 DUF2309 domain-containing protein [Dermatobacter hominis]
MTDLSTRTALDAPAPDAAPAARAPQVLPEPGVDPELEAAIGGAARRVAPAWPLESFVAVNPYLGMSELTFDAAARRLAAAVGATSAMDPSFYLAAIDRGDIVDEDVAAAGGDGGLEDLVVALRRAERSAPVEASVPTVASVAGEVTGQDWTGAVTDRIGSWASAYFDLGQAIWTAAERDLPVYASWRHDASVDRTPEILGLKGFRRLVAELPDDPAEAAAAALGVLGLPGPVCEAYLLALLLRVRGWSAHIARLCWESDRDGVDDDRLQQWIAVVLCWEAMMLRALDGTAVPERWAGAVAEASAADLDRPTDRVDALLRAQEAYDRSEQRRWIERFESAGRSAAPAAGAGRPLAQAVFCIDVRSEILRRHLEAADDRLETLGFAGFFGLPISHVAIGHDEGEAQCPVLLAPQLTVAETAPQDSSPTGADAARIRQRSRQIHRAWKSFKMGAVSCFSFVGPVGLAYLPKLASDSLGISRPVRDPAVAGLGRRQARRIRPSLDASELVPGSGVPVGDRVDLAEGMLRGMSLVDGFAPFVVLAGHGSTSANNPFAAGLDCGACGGHSGLVNARVAADLLNDPEVRAELASRGIDVPADTRFVAARHDTTTDDVELVGVDELPDGAASLLAPVRAALDTAAASTRRERAPRLGVTADRAADRRIRHRARDWAQVRPEWGLAGCSAFIAAPRHRTAGLDLEGRAFLHSYDWRLDDGFSVLELIMTAPMVVADWINLQYFGSTVDPEIFGAGDKTLHNVVGRLGVLEGAHGDLRSGLPIQSVHDGTGFQHQPVRLSAVVEAPIDAMDDVLERHPEVRALCSNGWVSLFAMGDDGRISHRYDGESSWVGIRD